jgi:hypothetical protein
MLAFGTAWFEATRLRYGWGIARGKTIFKFIIKPCLLTFGRALLATAFLVRFSGLCRRGDNVLP